MLNGSDPEGRQWLGTHPEPCTDHDSICVDAVAVRQLDRGDAPVVAGDDPAHANVDDAHPGGSQSLERRVVGVDTVVEDHGVPGAQLAEQRGGVKAHRMGDDVDDAPVANLEAMAERAVDHVAAPVLSEAVDVGQLVDEAGGGEHATGDDRVATDELDAEAVVVGAGHVERATGDDLASVTADLLATDRGELRRRQALVSEIAVHVGSGSIARFTGIDDDDRPSLAAELQRRGQTGRRSTDDGDVAVALDGAVGVIAHGLTPSRSAASWVVRSSLDERVACTRQTVWRESLPRPGASSLRFGTRADSGRGTANSLGEQGERFSALKDAKDIVRGKGPAVVPTGCPRRRPSRSRRATALLAAG